MAEQQVDGAYSRQVCRAAPMHILEHPALGSVHPEPVQGCVDGMPRRYVACPSVPESGVAPLWFRPALVDFLLESVRFLARENLVAPVPGKGLPIHPIHRGIEVLGFHQTADFVEDLRSLFHCQIHCSLILTGAEASPIAANAAQ